MFKLKQSLAFLFICCLVLFQACNLDDDTTMADPEPDPESTEFVVTYKATTSGDIHDTSMLTYKDGEGNEQTVALPVGDWEKEVTIPKGGNMYLHTDFGTIIGCAVKIEASYEEGSKQREQNPTPNQGNTDVFNFSLTINEVL